MGVLLRGGRDVAQVQAHVTTEDLELLSGLIDAGKLRPQIDRRCRSPKSPQRIAYLNKARARGKVVVEVA